MAETAASTAHGPMFLVAVERALPESQRILDDPLAIQMLPPSARSIVKVASVGVVRQAFHAFLDKLMPGLWNEFPCRKRYVQDQVADALKTQPQSVVILGAGLDTLAYRLPQLSTVHVYEVDLPDNIGYKRKRLEELYGTIPSHVTLVLIDFETQSLETVLKQAGYTLDQRTVFVWEGVTQYLTETAVRETFQFMAQAKRGSRLVFTYVQKDFIDGKNMYGLKRLYQRFRINSQLWLFGLRSPEVGAFIEGYGWRMLEQVGAEALSKRYLEPIGRNESVADLEWGVYAEKEV